MIIEDGEVAVWESANIVLAAEYSINFNDSSATRVWEYQHNPTVFARSQGGHHVTDNGLHLITWGNVTRPDPSATLVEANGNVISNIYFRDTVRSYRGYFQQLSFTIPQPEITCENSGGVLTLSAPMGHSAYQWSTGDTTASITVSNNGTYQVWVPHGIGFAGSAPFTVTDLSTQCDPNTIQEHNTIAKRIIGTFDLLGKPVQQPHQGQLIFIRYSDGSVQKTVWETSY